MKGDKNLEVQELVKQCKKGNQMAYKQLYDQYAPQMMGVCLRYAKSREVAQDLMHDGFVKVFSSIKSLKNDNLLGAWIKRIMVNVAINYVNREMRHYDDVDEVPDIALNDQSLDYDIFEVEYLLKVIQGLPDKYRLVFNLKEIEGYSFEEVAEELNVEQSSVRSILCRARRMIQEKIENDER